MPSSLRYTVPFLSESGDRLLTPFSPLPTSLYTITDLDLVSILRSYGFGSAIINERYTTEALRAAADEALRNDHRSDNPVIQGPLPHWRCGGFPTGIPARFNCHDADDMGDMVHSRGRDRRIRKVIRLCGVQV